MRLSLTSCSSRVSNSATGSASQIAVNAVADGHGTARLLLLADHKHVRDLFELGFADFVTDLFGPVVTGGTEAFSP